MEFHPAQFGACTHLEQRLIHAATTIRELVSHHDEKAAYLTSPDTSIASRERTAQGRAVKWISKLMRSIPPCRRTIEKNLNHKLQNISIEL